MKAFRFRAQAALDLRRREDEDATRALAREERRLFERREALSETARRFTDATREVPAAGVARDSLRDGQWHRSWIVRLGVERQTAARRVSDAEAAVARALAARQRTHQRLESLERFREKAVGRHEDAEDATEQKLLDALGTMRYTAARRA